MFVDSVYIGCMETPKNIILEAITGSRAYGLDTPESDTDKMGIFLADTEVVSGLHWGKNSETRTDCGPEGDDNTYHELGKFVRLTLRSNPTLIELYFMNEYTILSPEGADLLDHRDHILGAKPIRDAYFGYAYAQLREYERRNAPKPKMARHCMRIARQGVELLTTGTTNVRVSDRDEYFALDKMDFRDLLDKLEVEVRKLKDCDSVLPEFPNTDVMGRYLESVRYWNIGRRF